MKQLAGSEQGQQHAACGAQLTHVDADDEWRLGMHAPKQLWVEEETRNAGAVL
jgi:hypothetical protein